MSICYNTDYGSYITLLNNNSRKLLSRLRLVWKCRAPVNEAIFFEVATAFSDVQRQLDQIEQCNVYTGWCHLSTQRRCETDSIV